MELNLKRAEHEYYEPVAFAPFSCETMRESIVPDSCADIARIIDTRGIVCLTGRDLAGDGRISATGTVEVSVIYIPEQGTGPRSLRFQLPFQCYSEGVGDGDWAYLDVRAELRSIDTRALNPRKVLTRADVVLYPTACRHVKLDLCVGAEDDGKIQILPDKRKLQVVEAVREREFTFSEEMTLAPGREAMEELLAARVDLGSTDSKLIGNKLVVKGLLDVSVLYRDTAGHVGLLRQEMPYSQILDGTGLEESMEERAVCRIGGFSCFLGSDMGDEPGRAVTLEVQLLARSTAWSQKEIELVTDLYSIDGPVVCENSTLEMNEDIQQDLRRGSARETLETGTAVKSVIDTQVDCLGASATGDSLEVSVRARCLYLDENNALGSTGRTFTVSCPADLSQDSRILDTQVGHGDVMVNIVPEGVELRFSVDCTLTAARRTKVPCISGVQAGEEETTSSPTPSVILRKLRDGETLWSVAKQYRTTKKAILDVNELQEDALPTDRLLLIPKAR